MSIACIAAQLSSRQQKTFVLRADRLLAGLRRATLTVQQQSSLVRTDGDPAKLTRVNMGCDYSNRLPVTRVERSRPGHQIGGRRRRSLENPAARSHQPARRKTIFLGVVSDTYIHRKVRRRTSKLTQVSGIHKLCCSHLLWHECYNADVLRDGAETARRLTYIRRERRHGEDPSPPPAPLPLSA